MDPQAIDIERLGGEHRPYIYVANATDVMVFSYTAQRLLRTLVYDGFDHIRDVVVKENTLFVLDSDDAEIYVFNNISEQVREDGEGEVGSGAAH